MRPRKQCLSFGYDIPLLQLEITRYMNMKRIHWRTITSNIHDLVSIALLAHRPEVFFGNPLLLTPAGKLMREQAFTLLGRKIDFCLGLMSYIREIDPVKALLFSRRRFRIGGKWFRPSEMTADEIGVAIKKLGGHSFSPTKIQKTRVRAASETNAFIHSILFARVKKQSDTKH